MKPVRAGWALGMAVVVLVLVTVPAVAAQKPQPGFFEALGSAFEGIGTDFQRLTRGTTSREVDYPSKYRKGTIVIRTRERTLHLVTARGRAIRYTVGVGRLGYTWKGVSYISRKAKWPAWTPPPEMRRRIPSLPRRVKGGPDSPLGARALYLGSTLYRIHGTPWSFSVGAADSSGCIRMLNEDVIDLYNRTRIGAKVYVYQ